MNQDEFNDLWARRFKVLYRAELSVLYHQKRERFFELCDKLAKSAWPNKTKGNYIHNSL